MRHVEERTRVLHEALGRLVEVPEERWVTRRVRVRGARTRQVRPRIGRVKRQEVTDEQLLGGQWLSVPR